ncbi:MAG: hypothetical protein K2X82_25760, partial [Gemmataceae bacterium]|nr:hypothetical protein [Gemmataceae bacterium]
MSARAAVWGTWAGLTAAAVAFVLRFGRNCPLLDEWGMLDALAGRRPLLAFLWEPHAEHRYPAPRLVYALLFHTFHDLRAAMLASAVGLSAAAALLVAAAGRARGRPAAVDIVFPLLLLHWGHWENLLMAYQVCFVAVAVLVAVLLLLAATDRWGWGGTLFAAGAAVVLPGCGNLGLGYAPVAAVWLAFEAARGRRVGPRQGAVLVLAAGLALGLAGLAALHYPGSSGHLPERRAGEAVRFLVADLGLGFGTETRAAWPLFGAVGLVAVVAAGGGVASARRSRADAAGLTLLL